MKNMSFILLCSSVIIMACNSTPQQKIPLKTDTTKKTGIAIDSYATIKPTAIIYDTTKKYIYLTFDDGPQNGTKQCLDLCKKLGIKATFFMVGAHASSPQLKGLVKEIKMSYPQILLANHSTTHANGHYQYFYNHEYMAAEDFYLAQKTLEVPFKIIRLPGNNSWAFKDKLRANSLTKPVCKLLDSAGYNVMGWDVEWNFKRGSSYPVESPERIMNIVNNVFKNNDLIQKNHLVILTHDRMFRNANHLDSLATFINLVKQNPNYVFETMDHYPNLKTPL